MIEFDSFNDKGAKIRVVGIGGGGGNAINSMIEQGLGGVDFISINTDLQSLENNKAPYKVQIGKNLTRGLGAGADPIVGRKAVEENREDLANLLSGSDMVFVTAGMGGGTGTGGAPLVANIARSTGALVVGIVTKPFIFEARKRMMQAEEGILELKKHVDTLIVIPNERLLAIASDNTSLIEAFNTVNQVLYNATRGISELITVPGLVNVDFADVKTVMREMGDALMGTGSAKGENRSIEAAQSAISSPLLEGVSISGALGVLVNVTSSRSMTLKEVQSAASVIHNAAGEQANIIFGAVIDDRMDGEFIVTVIATGFNKKSEAAQVIGSIPKITKVPSGLMDLQSLDEPAYLRREKDQIDFKKILDVGQGFPQKIDKSNPDKPAFLRKIMD